MAKIYVDINDDFKCYASNYNGKLLKIEEPFFDGKCPAFIEAFRCVPEGYSWKRSDGEVFEKGRMITLLQSTNKHYKAQADFEHECFLAKEQELKKAEVSHVEELGALIEEIYTNDLEVIG